MPGPALQSIGAALRADTCSSANGGAPGLTHPLIDN